MFGFMRRLFGGGEAATPMQDATEPIDRAEAEPAPPRIDRILTTGPAPRPSPPPAPPSPAPAPRPETDRRRTDPLPPVTVSGRIPGGDNQSGYSSLSFPSNRPEADFPWRISHERVGVAGIHHRPNDVRGFAREVGRMVSRYGSDHPPFGLRLERDPQNRNDPNAIRVLGVTPTHPHGVMLGFIPREIAAELAGKELIAASASRYYESGKYSELLINVLERMPTKEERKRAAADAVAGIDIDAIRIDSGTEPHEIVRIAMKLKRAGRRDEAAVLLERVIDGYGAFNQVPLKYVGELAKLYKRRKDFDRERALLEKHAAGRIVFSKADEAVLARLEEVRQA